VLMVARRRAALVDLQGQIRRGQIGKTYRAIVSGKLPRRDQTLRQPLRRLLTADGDRRVVVDVLEGKPAVSHIRGLNAVEHAQAGWLSLVEVRIETGRTHQIRVHLATAGYPVIGDRKYGNFDLNRRVAQNGPSRMLLHALELKIRHPVSGEPLKINAEPPEAFGLLVAYVDPRWRTDSTR
ncbi:MAG: RluA family pseudouridine synthase, partial [Burkholderiaceae bacterium]